MSRISRYQDSVNRFIKTKSCITTLPPDLKAKLDDMTNNCDHVIGILLLTIMKSQENKTKMTVHGYYAASSIELMLFSSLIKDNRQFYEEKYGKKDIDIILSMISGLVNIGLFQNIEAIQSNYSSTNHTKLLKLIHNITKQLNTDIYKLYTEPFFIQGEKIKRTDATKYKFKVAHPEQKIKALHRVSKEEMLKYINDKYGYICCQAITIAWLLGGGDEKSIPALEKTALNFAYMVKCIRDYENLDRDLKYSEDMSRNIIINIGFQNAFEIYMTNKCKFIEGCMIHGIYTNTVKEIIDLLDSKLGVVINNSSPDEYSNYTLATE